MRCGNGIAILLLSSSMLMPGTGFAQDAAMGATPRMQDGIAFVTGGIGENDQNALKAMRKDYNLLLTFAVKKTGAYLADVKVNIQDAKGKKILETVSTGPLFYAKLPPGKYRITVASNERTLSKTTSIGKKGARDLYFYWEPL